MSRQLLGELIRKLRKEKKYSLRKLAEKVDVTYVNIAHIENGRVETTKSILKQISKALNYDLDKLLAVGNNVGDDIEKIITKKPDVVPEFLRTAKNLTKNEWKELIDQVKQMKRKK